MILFSIFILFYVGISLPSLGSLIPGRPGYKENLERSYFIINPLTPNDLYMSRTATLTSKRCIFYIYSRNIGTEYFKHALHSPFFFPSKCSLFQNANFFGVCIIHILYTECAEIKKKFLRQMVKDPQTLL